MKHGINRRRLLMGIGGTAAAGSAAVAAALADWRKSTGRSAARLEPAPHPKAALVNAAAGRPSRQDILSRFEWVRHPARPGQPLMLEGVSDVMAFKTTIAGDGRTELALRSSRDGGDAVSIALLPNAVPDLAELRIVTATGTEALFPHSRSATGQEIQERVRTLLAAPSVQRFKAIAAALDADDTDDDWLSATIGLSGALVSRLDGDRGAIGRIARRLARPGQRTTRAADFTYTDCLTGLETAVFQAYSDYMNCLYMSYQYWLLYFYELSLSYCEFEYMTRVYSYLFQMAQCSAFPR